MRRLLIICSLLPVALGCGAKTEPERIVAFGHSYVEGVGPARPWAARVAHEAELPLVNLGHSGDGCAATAAIAESYRARPTDVVLIENAINDTRRQGAPGAREYRACLTNLVRRIFRDGPPLQVILLADPPIIGWDVGPNRGSDEASLAFRKATFSAAADTGAEVIDLSRGWDKARDIGPDRIHPSDAGAERIARAVSRVLDARR